MAWYGVAMAYKKGFIAFFMPDLWMPSKCLQVLVSAGELLMLLQSQYYMVENAHYLHDYKLHNARQHCCDWLEVGLWLQAGCAHAKCHGLAPTVISGNSKKLKLFRHFRCGFRRIFCDAKLAFCLLIGLSRVSVDGNYLNWLATNVKSINSERLTRVFSGFKFGIFRFFESYVTVLVKAKSATRRSASGRNCCT